MNEPATPPILVVRHLSATFADQKGSLQALDDLSFAIEAQQFVCLLGPSGCGKSTLLRILAGLLRPTAGEVQLHGELLDGPSPRAGGRPRPAGGLPKPVGGLPRPVGYVFQNANLMPWRTVLENILLPLELMNIPHSQALEQARELTALVGLQGFEQALPPDLSGGMAQRVAIARALIHDPALLLLDEPFGSLDALTRERMGAELLQIWQKRRKTVVMVTHSVAEALFLADRVLVLSPRPGKLRLDLQVSLPRPREESMRYTSAFGELARQLRAAIG